MATRRAKITRPVYVDGKLKSEGDVVDLPHQTFNEMKSANYVVAHDDAPASDVAPAASVAPETTVAEAVPEASTKKSGK